MNIDSTSVETVTVTLRATADPTGDTIEFGVNVLSESDPSGSWVAGSWVSWTDPIAKATTPTLGGSGAAISLTEGTPVMLWCRIGGSGGTVKRVRLITPT